MQDLSDDSASSREAEEESGEEKETGSSVQVTNSRIVLRGCVLTEMGNRGHDDDGGKENEVNRREL